MNIDIGPLENMTDDEIRQYMAKDNGIFVTGAEIGRMRAMFSIKKSIKKIMTQPLYPMYDIYAIIHKRYQS